MPSNIYTRKGDDGSTGLLGGGRVSKSSARVEAYGEVDELNAFVGWAIAHVGEEDIRRELQAIQGDLFALGAQLADPEYARRPKTKEKTRITEARIESFERLIDRAEDETGPVREFILPGGSPAASALQILRAVTRRAERRVVAIPSDDAAPPLVVKYLNRLSDLFFALARLANRRAGVSDVPWR